MGEVLAGCLGNPRQVPLVSSDLCDHELEIHSGTLEISLAIGKYLS